MPFTFAHPAAAVPLLRPLGRFGSLSALVIGSMMPDLTFIIPLEMPREHTHGLAALFLFCLPAGLIVYALFHAVLKAPLLRLFPAHVQGQLALAAARPRAGAGALLVSLPVSLLLGALTHLAWDSFTHAGTLMVYALPLLRLRLWSASGYTMYLYNLLQYASSVLGLLLLTCWFQRWQRHAPLGALPLPTLAPAARRVVLILICALPVSAGMAVAAEHDAMPATMGELRLFFSYFIFTALPVMAAAVTGFCVLWHAWVRMQRS